MKHETSAQNVRHNNRLNLIDVICVNLETLNFVHMSVRARHGLNFVDVSGVDMNLLNFVNINCARPDSLNLGNHIITRRCDALNLVRTVHEEDDLLLLVRDFNRGVYVLYLCVLECWCQSISNDISSRIVMSENVCDMRECVV